MLKKNGVIVVASFVSPYRESRKFARGVSKNFIEVFMWQQAVEACERRDEKGHYQKARSGELKDFTGVDSAYETPEHPEIIADAGIRSAEEIAEQMVQKLLADDETGVLPDDTMW